MKLFAKIAIGAALVGTPLAAFAATEVISDRQEDAIEKAELANAPKPAVSEAQARAIALSVAKGEVAEAEYEKEDGSWRWSFDIRENGKVHEVGIDATSGAVVENGWELDKDDADED